MSKRKKPKRVAWGQGKYRSARVQKFTAKHPDSLKTVESQKKREDKDG